MKYCEIVLGDKQYFKLEIGKRVLRNKLPSIAGNIPVFSANVFEPFGFIDKSNFTSFDYDVILWGIDGNFDLNHIQPNTSFATTDHCGTITILSKNIEPSYLIYQLYLLKETLSFDRNFRASLSNMKRVKITIPIDLQGKFNLEQQKCLAEKYKLLTYKKNELYSQIKELNAHEISIPYFIDDMLETFTTKLVKEICDLSITTNNSFLTRDFVLNNPGKIPVFGASKFFDETGYGYLQDNLENIKYFSDCLTWNIDGSIGLFYREGRFSLSEKVIPLVIRDEFTSQITNEYLKYAILSEVMKKPFSFTHKGGKSRLGDIIVKIPVCGDKTDLKKQNEISKYCENVDKKNEQSNALKNNLLDNINGILKKQVVLY
ncbi:MAG: restriction endonuclease subunit S [Treponema sp.]|nr:restriction endonuclease subunit S [Treponema sp.]